MAAHAVLLAMLLVFACAGPASAGIITSKTFVSVNEGGTGDSYTIELGGTPSQPVEIRFHVPPGIQPISPLVFNATNWNQPQTVNVDAFDDVVHLASPGGQITHDVVDQGSGATIYPGDAPVMVSRFDNDYPIVFMNPDPAAAYAEGDVAHWYVTLNSRPFADVTLNLSVDPSEGTLLTPTITIPPSEWNLPHSVDVALDDNVDDEPNDTRNVTVNVTAVSSADPDYDGRTVPPGTGTFQDDDVAGVEFDPVAPAPVQVTEGGPDGSYRIRLTTRPAANVTVQAAPLSSGQLLVSPSLLVFTPSDWNTFQTVNVTAVDDSIPEPGPVADSILHTFSSADPAYASPTVPDVNVAITDNDSPAVIVAPPANTSVAEADPAGTERVISIKLATAPVGTVRVIGISDGQVSLAGTSALNFTSSNWNTAQQLHVRAVDDSTAEPDPHPGRISFQIIAANDPAYASQSVPPQVFQVADDDLANASLQCVDGPNWGTDAGGNVSLAEDPAAPTHQVGCYVQVGTPPSVDVTLSMTTNVPGQVVISPPSVTIPAGSTTSQLVNVTANDDAVAEANPHLVRMSYAVTSGDPVYGLLVPAPVTFAIADNDVPGVKLTPPPPHGVAEGGADLALAVSLRSQPTSQVTLTVDPGQQLRLVAPSPTTLLFTPSNWNVPQSVMIAAIDDYVAEPGGAPAPLTFTVASSDPTYQGLPTPTFPIAVTDNDVSGLNVVPTGTDNAVREGATAPDSIGFKLSSQPTQNVTVTLANDAQVSISATSLVFTPTNWNVAQNVDVTAVQDSIFEGPHVGLIRVTLASADPMYDSATGGVSPPPIEVKVTDDDPAGATVTESDGNTTVAESGGTDTYMIVLNSQPTAEVKIKPDGAPQVTTQPAEIVFTASNWNVPQTVTVSAVQDNVDEVDPHTMEIKHVVTTQAAGWAGQQVASVTAKIADDDAAGVVVTESDGSTRVAEGGATDTVTFKLSSQPTSDVTLNPSGDAQLMIDKKPLVLTPANWSTPVTLKVVAKDDEEDEGDHTGTLTVSVASSDPSYAKATVTPIEVKIADDDGSDVTIQPGDGTDGGDDDGAGGDRSPRGTTDTDSGRGGGTSSDGSSTTTERTDGESGPADATTDLATDDGLDLGAIGAGTSKKDDTAKEDTQLDGEAVSDTEAAPKKHAKKQKPNPVQKAVKKAVTWTKDNQETVATVGGVGLMATGAGTFLLRGDPIKVAQRGMSALDGASKVPGGPKHKPHPRLRKARGKKRRRDDDDEEETADVGGGGDGDGPDAAS